MIRLKSNGKIIGMLAMLSIMVIGLFSVCAQAASYGPYAKLTGSCYLGSDGNYYASSTVQNTSGITRYINTSVRKESDIVLVATGGKVGSTAKISTGSVNIYNYTGIYAQCWVYNSASPQSGVTGQAMIDYIR